MTSPERSHNELDGEVALDASLLQWINAFSDVVTTPITSITALCDGVLLSDLMHHLDPDHFADPDNKLRRDAGNNFLLRVGNLSKLIASLQTFCDDLHLFGGSHDEEKTGGSAATDFSFINVSSIARHEDTGELMKLLEIVLFCAVNTPGKEQVVEHIMGLSEDAQHHLMFIINEVMTKHKHTSESTGTHKRTSSDAMESPNLRSPGQSTIEPSSFHIASTSHLNDVLIEDIKNENVELKKRVETLTASNKELKKTVDQLEEQTHNHKREMETAVADAVSRVKKEQEELRYGEERRATNEREKLRIKMQEIESELRARTTALDTYKAKAEEELAAVKSENRKLQDGVLIAKEKEKELATVTSQLDKYKAKIQELNEMRQQVKAAEEEHQHTLEKLVAAEALTKTIPSLKEQVAKWKEQLKEAETKCHELEANETQLQEELKFTKELVEQHDNDRKRLQAERDQARDEIAALKAKQDHNDMAYTPVRHSLDDVPALKEKIMRLEAENRQLRESAGGDGSGEPASDVATLQKDLEKTKTLLKMAQEKQRESHRQVLELTQQLKTAQATAPPVAAPVEAALSPSEHKRMTERIASLVEQNTQLKQQLAMQAQVQAQLQAQINDAAARTPVKPSGPAPSPLSPGASGGTPAGGAGGAEDGDFKEKFMQEKAKFKKLVDGYRRLEAIKNALEEKNKKVIDLYKQSQADILDLRAENKELNKIKKEAQAEQRLELMLMGSAFFEMGNELTLAKHMGGNIAETAERPGPAVPVPVTNSASLPSIQAAAHMAQSMSPSTFGVSPHRHSWLSKQRMRYQTN